MKWNKRLKIFAKEFVKMFVMCVMIVFAFLAVGALVAIFQYELNKVMPMWATGLIILLIICIITGITYAISETRNKCKTKD